MRTDRRSTGRGRGICIGIIDSGVHAAHPHVKGVAGGIGLDARGQVSGDYVDRIGHGTAVTAAIREKAPAADCYAIRIFDARLAASSSTLLSAIEWAVAARVHVINLSLGSTNRAHEPAFASAVARARAAGVAIVAARDEEGVEWLPGCLPGVVQVQADWDCPREELRVGRVGDGHGVRCAGRGLGGLGRSGRGSCEGDRDDERRERGHARSSVHMREPPVWVARRPWPGRPGIPRHAGHTLPKAVRP